MLDIRLHQSIRCTFAVVMILCASAAVHAGVRTITTSDQLLDRINIEDMFHDYYLIVGKPDRSQFMVSIQRLLKQQNHKLAAICKLSNIMGVH